MGIRTKAVNVYGVKYDLDAYNDRVRTESENELIKLGQTLGKNYSDYPLYYDDEDLITFLEEVVISETQEFGYGNDLEMLFYGNTVCDTTSDPFGIILHPKTHEAQEFLKELLVKIGSNKRLGQHSEVEIG